MDKILFIFLVCFIIYLYEIQWKIIKEESYIVSISRISHKLKTVEHQSITRHTLLDYSILVRRQHFVRNNSNLCKN